LAEKLTLALNTTEPPIYLATTEFIEDRELQQRIALHRLQRGERFVTIEESLWLHQKLPKEPRVVLIECLTMWLNNLLHHEHDEAKTFSQLEELWESPHQLVLVLNEVGLGIIPNNPLARRFTDLSGRVGQWLGEHCDQVFFCAAGLPLQLK
jgi:adenosylcobinamide kinase/adenosylcobinamide-phosphate guanylyltransferase